MSVRRRCCGRQIAIHPIRISSWWRSGCQPHCHRTRSAGPRVRKSIHCSAADRQKPRRRNATGAPVPAALHIAGIDCPSMNPTSSVNCSRSSRNWMNRNLMMRRRTLTPSRCCPSGPRTPCLGYRLAGHAPAPTPAKGRAPLPPPAQWRIVEASSQVPPRRLPLRAATTLPAELALVPQAFLIVLRSRVTDLSHFDGTGDTRKGQGTEEKGQGKN